MLRLKPYHTKRWLSSKPYHKPTAYDEEMTLVGRELEADLKGLTYLWREMEIDTMTQPELINLVLGYLEDQVSQVGFWRAFTQRNEQLIGKPLPFWNLDDYEPDQVNLADTHYLVWHFFNTWTDRIWAPDAEFIQTVAERLYHRLADAYEYVPETDYFEAYLSIKPEDDFFAVKAKLIWWARAGYLLRDEFGHSIMQGVLSVQENNPQLAKIIEPSALIYSVQDPYLYVQRSSYAAMTVPEWMAKVVRGSDEVKASLLAMKRYFNGKFRYEGTDENYHHFVHPRNGRSYPLRIEDFPLQQSDLSVGEFMQFPLVPWQGKWYMSGLATKASPDEPDSQTQAYSGVHYKYASEAEQATMRESVGLMEQAFLETFGQPVVLFDSEEKAQKKLREYTERYQQMAWDKIPPDERPQTRPEVPNSDFIIGTSDEQGRLGVVLIAGQGLCVLSRLYELVEKLRQEDPLPRAEAQQLFWRWLGEECPPTITQYLLDHEPTHQLKLPMPSKVDWIPELPFLQRYFFPKSFDEPTPEMSAVIWKTD
jgi:hypothetical protein